MPNSRGTIMCQYCKHYTTVPEREADPGLTSTCHLYDVDIGKLTIGWDNTLCLRFEEGSASHPMYRMAEQFAELVPHMQSGKLYAYSCDSRDRVADLYEIRDLK